MGSLESLKAAHTALRHAQRQFAEWSASGHIENGPDRNAIYLLKQGIVDSLAAIFRDYAKIPKEPNMPDFLGNGYTDMDFLHVRLATVMLDVKGDLKLQFGDNIFAEVMSAALILCNEVREHNKSGILADAPDAGKALLSKVNETVYEESTGLAWLDRAMQAKQ